MPFPLNSSLPLYTQDLELLGGWVKGAISSKQDPGKGRRRHEPSPKGLFLWHKEDSLDKQDSSPPWGIWRGCFGHLHPVPHSQIRACPPCIPHKSRPLCKIPAEKNRDILKNKNPGLGVGSCLAVSGGCIQLEAQEYSWNVFQMLRVPEGLLRSGPRS